MDFWPFLIGFGIFYAINTVLGFRQAKHFSSTFIALRRRGRVGIGKRKGLVASGAIVMFLLDDDGRILEGTRMSGVTAMARFRALPAFDGELLSDLAPQTRRELAPSVRLAAANARDNYLVIAAGGVAAEPPGPWARIAARLSPRRIAQAPA